MPKSTLDTPLGKIVIQTHQGALVSLSFSDTVFDCVPQEEDSLITHIRQQLTAWFQCPAPFLIPLAPHGTPFQKKVWQALCQIPCGETVSYSTLAARLGTSARAIGNACRANPVPVIIPCHRVVSKNGLGGYSGATTGKYLQIKAWLISHEKRS